MLHSKVAMKGLGMAKKRLQHNIVDLFSGSPADPDRWSLDSEWTYTQPYTHTLPLLHTHTHTDTVHTQSINFFQRKFLRITYLNIKWPKTMSNMGVYSATKVKPSTPVNKAVKRLRLGKKISTGQFLVYGLGKFLTVNFRKVCLSPLWENLLISNQLRLCQPKFKI